MSEPRAVGINHSNIPEAKCKKNYSLLIAAPLYAGDFLVHPSYTGQRPPSISTLRSLKKTGHVSLAHFKGTEKCGGDSGVSEVVCIAATNPVHLVLRIEIHMFFQGLCSLYL